MQNEFIVASITVLITLFGTLCNIIVLISAQRMNSMRSSFGIITKNQAICNTLMCLLFLLCVVPMQLSISKVLLKSSRIVGVLVTVVYDVSNQSHLFLSLNRFCAVYAPLDYDRLFKSFFTKVAINIFWILSLIKSVVLYEIVGCFYSYDPNLWTFGYLATEFCSDMSFYSDFVFNNSLVIITIILNLFTAYRAKRNTRFIMNQTGMTMSKRQREREWNFVKQTFFQGFCIFTGQISYYVIAPFFTNVIFLFVLSVIWAFMHSIEGFVILASNEEMRRVFVKDRKKQPTSIVFVSSNSKNNF